MPAFVLHLDTSEFVTAVERVTEAIARLGEALARHPRTPDPKLVERLARLSKAPRTQPRLNGVRVVHGEARLRGFDGISGRRWRPTVDEPTRVRTCRGKRS